jgi:hypothetical protein
MSIVKEFNDYRQKMNDRILAHDNKVIKRFWSLDHQTYDDGALDKKTKELLGLAMNSVSTAMKYLKYSPLPIWWAAQFVSRIPAALWSIGRCLKRKIRVFKCFLLKNILPPLQS